ncbi:sensor histidine kinase [Cohnella pontilimi]|uniref:Circadian input-output histidine kinase CikA n=1 Tax=Cohnella pontilimi TaxID=2564100 RepID=A0A4U0FCW2_9BACL|nr:ATP-binding protein [Cohnella pontilimi]TJY42567.1 sensor histidine kinase [Cohnella pontilimi]
MGALLVKWFKGKGWPYKKKAIISVFSIISLQVICIITFGALPRDYYLTSVAPFSYPATLLMSLFFVFIISEFYKEQLLSQKLRKMNLILRRQTKELRTAKSELAEQAAQLLTASKYKSEFIANISHELRTPLNSIILLSQMIKENEEGSYKEQEVSYAGGIHSSGQDLLSIINDILDLSKVEAGKMELNTEWASLDDLFEGIMYEFEPIARHKGLHFEIITSPGLPNGVMTDVLRVRQILRNLLMNAFKFTEKGSVCLEVAAADDRLIFTVTDTGIGISADKHQDIFEAFRQEEGAVNRKYGGTGLGLSVSLQLAKLLGGTVTVDSRKGVGSRFSLIIPVHSPLHADESGSKESNAVTANHDLAASVT